VAAEAVRVAELKALEAWELAASKSFERSMNERVLKSIVSENAKKTLG
jgi:hypothetical protein